MLSSLKLKTILAAVFVVAISAAPTLPAQDLGIDVGKRAPAAVVQTLDGKQLDIGQYVGKTPMFIEFWATWCAVP